ncbi:MAG: YggS family pyridoxal phosphate-dependent enzyme [Dehalococcoidia bacterium]|nr:MAG: YggS family pyridoxal phosphate-dependent enzyme [Dehalococcoidia bacterium]
MAAPTAFDIAANVAAVRARIAEACARAGRDPAGVTLVAVTKGHPLDLVRAAVEAGCVDLGENRAQELLPKADAAAAAGLTPRPRWHFIGHLQRNKVHEVLPRIEALHSLDSAGLLREIERRAREGGRPHRDGGAATSLPCYLEVNVGGEAQKQGVSPEALPDLLRAARACEVVEVRGLMTVAPHLGDPEAVRPVFRALRLLARAHGLNGLSMGMTEDYPVAVEEGATVVRVGRAIFGARPG